jgi:UDP-galactopyranose mutase
VFGLSLACGEEVRDFLAGVSTPHPSARNAAEFLRARVGARLTDLLFRPYTKKMWATDLEGMSAEVVRRLPVRHDDEDRYFAGDRFQALPKDGYTELVRRMLDHPSIRVSTGTPFHRPMLEGHEACFASMAIDDFFDGVLGPLPYRSIRFHHREVGSDAVLGPTSQTNFADASPYTRQDDWALLPGHVVRATGRKTVTLEEPCDYRDNGFERYYPVPDGAGANAALYERYRALAAKEPKVRFVGRCGTYRYLNMDQVVAQSLKSAEDWLAGVPSPERRGAPA